MSNPHTTEQAATIPSNTPENEEILDQCHIESFDDLLEPVEDIGIESGFKEEILRGIYNYGFESPSYIQKVGIRAIATGKDVIGQAQSGTGKTGAFTIGLLNTINEELNEVQGVILVHTYEMVMQIASVIDELSKYTNIRSTICAKGVSVRDNIAILNGSANDGNRPHIIIGTPGRTLDMLNRKDDKGNYVVNTGTIKCLVMDEADELLGTTEHRGGRNSGRQYNNFINQIRDVIKSIPEDTQICLFSATMNNAFFKLATKFMRTPLQILVKTEEITLDGISQFAIDLDEQDKVSVITDLYDLLTISKCVIYCNNKGRVNYLYEQLSKNNYACSIIHSDLTPSERDDAMCKFRRGQTNVLISTDLIGRGIDIQQLSVVINYDIPFKAENYIHRIGRSGRHGRKGVAINFITPRDDKRVNFICQYYSTNIEPLPDNVSEIINEVA